ncbi:hypothetical protein Hypma_009815 [Hypsizygus marmoreus]|uniref:Exportin-2 central domain-containing protein n=1 Tax=Hypsizygus marmoreus TaxID=39966 RepID=A0A369JNX7_HYPMA|nr:hypothetical protein Hypma_009815 [Hypsizygus marmoreus]
MCVLLATFSKLSDLNRYSNSSLRSVQPTTISTSACSKPRTPSSGSGADQLFSEINLILSKFVLLFLGLFRQTATFPTSPSTPRANLGLAQAMVLLIDIFYDFTCQDLPPAIEDAHAEFFGPGTEYFHVFLSWDPTDLRGDPDDTIPSLPSQIKTVILRSHGALHQTIPRPAPAISRCRIPRARSLAPRRPPTLSPLSFRALSSPTLLYASTTLSNSRDDPVEFIWLDRSL